MMHHHPTTLHRLCAIFNCSRPHYARDLCKAHYGRSQKGKDLKSPIRTSGLSLEERFWANVTIGAPDECWPWTGYKNRDGYGQLKVQEKGRSAHQIAYELSIGPIPNGLELDHLCRTRDCANPSHLEPVSHKENVLRGVGAGALNAQKTECTHGHIFDEANTYITKEGYRRCRECNRHRMHAEAQEQRVAEHE